MLVACSGYDAVASCLAAGVLCSAMTWVLGHRLSTPSTTLHPPVRGG